MTSPEARARAKIDQQLLEAGWIVQHRDEFNRNAGPGVALREFSLPAGPCDYLLFVGGKAAGVIEAKPAGTTLSGVTEQSSKYMDQLSDHLASWADRLLFAYESTGEETTFETCETPTPARVVCSLFTGPRHCSGDDPETPYPGGAGAPAPVGRPFDPAALWQTLASLCVRVTVELALRCAGGGSTTFSGDRAQRARRKVVGSASLAGGAAAESIKVAAWNINDLHHLVGEALRPDAPERSDADYALLREYRDRLGADVFALQEVNGPKAAALVFPPDQYQRPSFQIAPEPPRRSPPLPRRHERSAPQPALRLPTCELGLSAGSDRRSSPANRTPALAICSRAVAACLSR